MRRYLGLALAVVLAAVSVSALAMGLGEIHLNSHLNQRLDAEIELVSAAGDELESLTIQLADRQAYDRYGLERSPVLNTLQFDVVRRTNGTSYIKVTSSEAIKEPFLTFLIEARWSRGRLLREYTVLLNPPTFASSDEARDDAAVAEAPSAAPEASSGPAGAGTVSSSADRSPEPRVAEESTGDVISIPSLDSEREEGTSAARTRSAASARSDRDGGTYGPIQRNETLWGLAMRLRPDESITINQMMMALFRANPEAFQGNINRLKAGYILRIPEYADIRSMDRGEAFREVSRHNEEWQTGARVEPAEPASAPADTEAPAEGETPELSLVAPEEESVTELGTDVGAGGEAEDAQAADAVDPAGDDIDADAIDLGIESESPDRLLDLEDESLQALQEQDSFQEEPAESEPDSAEVTGEVPADDATDDTAVTDDAVAEDAAVDDAGTETAEEAATERDRAVPVVPVRQPAPTLLDRVLSPLGLGLAAALLVLLLAAALVMRKRREASRTRAAAEMAEWHEEETDEAALIADSEEGGAPEEADAMATDAVPGEPDDVAEEAGDEFAIEDADKTQMMHTPVAGVEEPVSEDTVAGDKPVTLDENDPMSEADFHMAYGLYDQAAEVVQKAVERDPSRKDWLAKLAEIHFAANNIEGFLETARRLKEVAGPGDADWDNVAIMGRQIAADDPLFADSSGSTASVDLDFDTAGEEFGEPESSLDVSPEAETQAEESTTSSDDSLDFDMSFDTETTDADEPAAEAEPAETADAGASSSDDDGLDFDLDLGDLAASDEPPASDEAEPAAEEPAAEPEQERESASAGEDSDFDFDLGELDTFGETADNEVAADEPEEQESDSAYDDSETQTEFDKALQELSAYVDTNLPEQDAGDAVESGDDPSNELNLDEFNFDQAADDLDADSAEGTGEDEEDIGEIGTKLDLARAYIDMGDPDGARGILDEVMSDGDEDQKKEAQELLDQLA